MFFHVLALVMVQALSNTPLYIGERIVTGAVDLFEA